MKFLEWLRSQPTLLVDLIRMYLGVALFAKGVFFLIHPEQLVSPSDNPWLAGSVQVLPYVHIAGGLLLASGFLTRLACLVQVPILIGAIVFVSLPRMTGLQSREGGELTGLVLFLLTLLFFWGAGQYSLSSKLGLRSFGIPQRYQQWFQNHGDIFVDAVRVYLGVGLFLKGVYIMTHRQELNDLAQTSGTSYGLVLGAAHYVVPAHLVGGALLALGLATRPAAIAQLPLLIGAVFLVNLPQFSSLARRENLELSVLVLFLLVLLSLHGAGRFSLDHLLEQGLKSDEAKMRAGRIGAEVHSQDSV